ALPHSILFAGDPLSGISPVANFRCVGCVLWEGCVMTNTLFRKNGRPTRVTRGLAVAMCCVLQTLPMHPARAAPGGIVDNSGKIPFDAAFFAFEVEGALSTLKEVATWDELEQMLDNPYLFALDPSVPGNFQGFPSYRTFSSIRRQSFIYRDAARPTCSPPR